MRLYDRLLCRCGMMVLTGRRVDAVSLQTPQGTVLQLIPEDVSFGPQSATCAIRKDSGDDPDITDGMLVYGTVEKTPSGLSLIGGEGVGRVTQPGLACAVGDWAINPVPRRMITEALQQACQQCGYTGGLRLTLSIPDGRYDPYGNGFPPRCRPGSFIGLFRQLRRRFQPGPSGPRRQSARDYQQLCRRNPRLRRL